MSSDVGLSQVQTWSVPERRSTRLGTSAPRASSSVTLPAWHLSPTQSASFEHTILPYHSQPPSETIIDASGTRGNSPTEHTHPSAIRSQSCSRLPHQQTYLFSSSFSPLCISSLQAKDCEDFSSWLPALANQTPQTPTSREELTRLLDHVDSASPAGPLATEESLLSTVDTARPENCSHVPEASCFASLTPVQSQEAIRSAGRFSVGGTRFRLLGNSLAVGTNRISTAADTSETYWPTTLSRHSSTSTLLPRSNMSRGITEPDENGTPGSDGGPESRPESNNQGAVQPVRRTTPIYQNYDQAYISITGGFAGARFDSQPGTDSLNNVYARAMNEEATTSTRSFIPSNDPAAGIGGPVQFPFHRSVSPENNDHMNIQDAGDNPAGMRIEPRDVALQPILRTVPRSSVMYSTSLPREPSSLAFHETNSVVRSRATSVPMRSPTPYPSMVHDDDRVEPSLGAIFDQYGGSIEASSLDEQSNIAGPSAGEFRVHPRQRHTLTTAGPPPAWPLPVEPPAMPGVTSSNATQSSSPPTYGASMDLLAPRRCPASALREQVLRLPQRAMARNSSLYSSELDELIARHSNTSTPFEQIGDPGPAISSSPHSLSPAQGGGPRPRVYESGVTIHFDRPRTQDGNVEPSSSSGIGIALTTTDDPVVRYEQASNVASLSRVGVDTDDDAAWETTQGSNTQRNSAIPEADDAAFSSSESLGRQATSTWDPLAATIRGLAEAERDFAELQIVQAQGTGVLGGVQTRTPEHSMDIGSLGQYVHAGPSTSIASPDQTFTSTTNSRAHNNNYYQQSLPGTSLFTRTPRTNIPLSDTIVNMSSETGSDNERAARIAAVEEEIRRYEPRPSEDGPRRFFPEARLTTDRRVLDAENDEAFVCRQHRLARLLLASALVTYPLGGFLLVNSMANNGPVARSALLSLSLSGGGSPINNVHPADMALAERVETAVLCVVGAAVVAIVAVLGAFLRGALA